MNVLFQLPLAPDVGARVLAKALLRLNGGPGSGNFNHIGRPGQVGGSERRAFGTTRSFVGTALPQTATIIAPGEHFDLKEVGTRRFLYNSKSGQIVLGVEQQGPEGDTEWTHGTALDDAQRSTRTDMAEGLLRFKRPVDYDSFELRGSLGSRQTKDGSTTTTGIVIAQRPLDKVKSSDVIDDFLTRMRGNGADDETVVESFGVRTTLPKFRAYGGPGSGNFGHVGRPGSVGGSEKFFHGTTVDIAKKIKKEGLKPLTNNQAFVSTSEKTALDFGAFKSYGDKRVAVVVLHNEAASYFKASMKSHPEYGISKKTIPPNLIKEVRVYSVKDVVTRGFDPSKLAPLYVLEAEDIYVTILLEADESRSLGGPGSGNFGHAGRPGEVGGSGKVVYHGTTSSAIERIKREGLKRSMSGSIHYGVSRPGVVYVTGDLDRARSWAEVAVRKLDRQRLTDLPTPSDLRPVVLEVHIPKNKVAYLGADRNFSTDQSFEFPIDIDPSWIKGVWQHDKSSGPWRTLADAYDIEVFYIVVMVETDNEPKALAAPETEIHTVADSHFAKIRLAVEYAFAEGRRAVDRDALKRATTLREAEEVMSEASMAVEEALHKVLPKTLLACLRDGGEAAFNMLEERIVTLGGPGSGNFGHAGRPGSIGGSATKDASWRSDRLARVPAVLYRNTEPGSFEETSRDYVGGELGGGLYFNADEEAAIGYAGVDFKNGRMVPIARSVHYVAWERQPSDKEVAYAAGEADAARLIRGDDTVLWTYDSSRDWKQNRADMLLAGKENGIGVVVGLSDHEGGGQIAVLDKTLLKLTKTRNLEAQDDDA